MPKSKKDTVGRRGFLKRAAAGAAAALTVKPAASLAQPQTDAVRPAAPPASARQVALETSPPPPRVDVYTTDRPGADFMVDVLKSLNFDYIFANPGSSFRGLQESFINYGEEHEARVDHVLPRRVVRRDGARLLQDRRQADRSAWRTAPSACSTRRWRSTTRTPIACRCTWCSATSRTIAFRRSDVEWAHTRAGRRGDGARLHEVGRLAASRSATSPSRPCTAYKVAMTPPYGPVVLVRRTAGCRKSRCPKRIGTRCRFRSSSIPTPPAGDPSAVVDAAKMLVAADNPVIVAGRVARTPNGIKLLVELAETLQADGHRPASSA